MSILDRIRKPEPPDIEGWIRTKTLMDYRGRVAQGIVHTPEYVERMKAEQAWYASLTTEERERAFRGGPW